MAVYAIGDLQGCFDPLEKLLDRIGYDPGTDTLWFAGDIVNRGPQSLATLRYVRQLGDNAVCVLGNHDLHLLAVAAGHAQPKKRDTLAQILDAPDCDELTDWLRRRPLAVSQHGFLMIHAGLPPQWDVATTLACAAELEAVLRGSNYYNFLAAMYGDEPDRWDDSLEGMDRLRYIVNCLTRLRYCQPDGRLCLDPKGPPGTQPAGLLPWFRVPGRASATAKIVFGHWSTLGQVDDEGIFPLDSGCVWGGKLSAICLDEPTNLLSVQCRQGQSVSIG